MRSMDRASAAIMEARITGVIDSMAPMRISSPVPTLSVL
jgi:hypothetical protein